MRDVYHHFTRPEDIDRSLLAALKPGGRLAVIDFEPKPGSALPDGVPANRGGHGIHPETVSSEVAGVGLQMVSTRKTWPDEKADYFLVLFRKPAP
jgi:predicted methyltransferase